MNLSSIVADGTKREEQGSVRSRRGGDGTSMPGNGWSQFHDRATERTRRTSESAPYDKHQSNQISTSA